MEDPVAQSPPLASDIRLMPAPTGARAQLVVLPQHPCVYLPDRMAQMRACIADNIDGQTLQSFLDMGFRRSGRMIYQPVCESCRECVSIRIPVERFSPSKSQRRCWRRNQDLKVEAGEPIATDEKFTIYDRYMRQWHGDQDENEREAFEGFLYDSPACSREFCYRDPTGALLAVGLCDLAARSLSSVYFYFDPQHAHRGLGTFGALWEIDFARGSNIPYYYLGYRVHGCGSMQYKERFRPHELLCADGVWRDGETISRVENKDGQE